MAGTADASRVGLCFNGGPCEGDDEDSVVTGDREILN